MDALLPPAAHDLLADERRLFGRLQRLLEHAGTDDDTAEQVEELADGLSELFLVVVVGEFNAGKSSVLNALFGEKLMEEGPVPTTAKITILRHGRETQQRQLSEYLVERRHPSDILRYLHLVDTPGTNSIVKRHQEITERFVPRADLVLFVTSYDRPLTESERQFLDYIREAWGKRLVVVLNKADLARDDASLRQVIAHIESGCRELMGFEPEIFPVSAELAFEAKTAGSEAARRRLWESSRFEPFEDFVTDRLAGQERLRLKLLGPLDTALRLLERLDDQLDARRTVLARDEDNLSAMQRELSEAEAELQAGYDRHLTAIDNLLLELERRGVQFLDDTIRIGKVGVLRDRDRFKEEFNRQVVRDTDRQIEGRVTEAVDELLEQALRLWNRTLRAFATRMQEAEKEAPAVRETPFAYNRQQVHDALMREARRRAETYDVQEEGRRILENAREAADTATYVGAGAAGLGLLGGALVVSTTLDAMGGFGLATAAALGAGGLLVLPRQRRKAIREFKEQVERLRHDTREALSSRFDREISGALDSVRETVAPHRQLVEDERATLDEATDELAALHEETERLRAEARALFQASDDAGAPEAASA